MENQSQQQQHPIGEQSTGREQMRRDDTKNQPSDVQSEDESQGQATRFLQETGTQAINMVQGATSIAANVVQGAADVVKNTLGLNNSNTNSNTGGENLLPPPTANSTMNPSGGENQSTMNQPDGATTTTMNQSSGPAASDMGGSANPSQPSTRL